ncbi:MAG: glycosyltransferase family 4 protein, partial [Candidatus Micrarchaeia archaeon]
GRLTKQKDQETLIKGLHVFINKYMNNQRKNVFLTIVGAGELERELKSLCSEYRLNENVIFTGPQYDVSNLIKRSDIFILSSLWEGFPLAILEAMALKVPVIATNVGSVDEIIEDKKTGILINPNSPEEIAESIYILLKNKELRERIIENAFRKVSENFTIERCARDHLDLYKKILKS